MTWKYHFDFYCPYFANHLFKNKPIMKKISPIINPKDLTALMLKNKVRLIDARVGADIQEAYKKQHLLGATYVDLEQNLANRKPDAADGGRHPLPEIQKFAHYLGSLGIGTNTHVVVYDDKNGANAAARFWWMLRAVGHKKVQVLDGGFQAALAYPIPTSDTAKKYRQKPPYPVSNWLLPLADMKEVEAVAKNPGFTVIDVRDGERYRGEKEPIDLIAGHIPGATNMPFSTNLDAQGAFIPKETLKKQYETQLNNRTADKIIVHCGSGVTACHTLLAMDYAGFEMPKLYVGSWSEWSRNDKKIGLGAE
jgi:thiosulfate/3-mercaptopyruvate sulfurtransferase